MAKESDITTIRIPKSVKDELNGVATEKEPYHATISRLISENKQLKKTNKYNEDYIEILRDRTKDAQHFFVGLEFLRKTTYYYEMDSNYCYPLMEWQSIHDVLYDSNKTNDEKIIGLKDAFESCSDVDLFFDALGYIASEFSFHNQNSTGLEIINDFMEYMLENNPYDEKTNADEHNNWYDLFSMNY